MEWEGQEEKGEEEDEVDTWSLGIVCDLGLVGRKKTKWTISGRVGHFLCDLGFLFGGDRGLR